jgi:hypothetical protein
MPTILTEFKTNSPEITAEFAKLAGIVNRYTETVESAGARNRQRAVAEVAALKMEAGGHKDAAAAIRQKIEIQEEAARLAKSAGITESSALRLTKMRIELERQLAAEKMKTASVSAMPARGRAMLPELPLTTAEMNRTFVATAKTSAAIRGLQSSGKAGSFGLLAVSQGFEDLQYGIKGVLNNIPQAVLGFGGSAGLAGALSITAVAGYQLTKMMYRLGGGEEAKKMLESVKAQKTGFDALTASLIKNRQAAEDRLATARSASRQQEIEDQQANRREKQLIPSQNSDAAYQQQQDANARLRAARDAINQATASQDDPLGAARSKFVTIYTDAVADLQAAQQRSVQIGKEWATLREGEAAAATELQVRAAAAAAEAEELRKLVEARDANIAALRAERDATKDGEDTKQLKRDIKDQEELRAQLNRRLKEAEALEQTLAAQARQTSEEARAALKDLEGKADAIKKEIILRQEQIKLNDQLAVIEANRLKQAAAQSRTAFREELQILRARLDGDQKTLDALDRKQRIETEITRLMREQAGLTREQAAAAAAKKADAQDALRDQERALRSRDAITDAAQEIQVLRLRAAGREKEAAALEKEFKVRADALRLAKDANITEEQALQIIRERQRLQDQIAANSGRQNGRSRPRARIYKKDEDDIPGFGRARFLGEMQNRRIQAGIPRARTGLLASVAERQAAARTRNPEAAARVTAQTYYEKSLSQNEQLLQIWKTLGVA